MTVGRALGRRTKARRGRDSEQSQKEGAVSRKILKPNVMSSEAGGYSLTMMNTPQRDWTRRDVKYCIG